MKRKAVILYVEDNRMDIDLTLDAFREAHLDNEIMIYNTGEAALDFLLGHGKYADRNAYPLPDLVLLDIKLPGISGLDVLKTIKRTPVIKRLPVVIITSSTEEGDRIMSYDLGANSYLVKPITFDDLINTVKVIYEYWLSLNINAPIE